MKRIAMLGSGFIGRFYADSLQGQRSKEKIVMIYSRREEAAQQFAKACGSCIGTHNAMRPAEIDVDLAKMSIFTREDFFLAGGGNGRGSAFQRVRHGREAIMFC